LIGLLLLALPATDADAAEVEQNETIQKTYPLSGAAPKKSSWITSTDRSMSPATRATKSAWWRTSACAPIRRGRRAARRDVKLDISQDANTVRFYVDGPFRCRDGGVHIDRDPGYEVKYDFELQVPHDTAIDLKTVNDGEIAVEDVAGDYKVNNINGGVEMTEMSGSGKVYALNGNVKVTFRENPRGKSSFGSLNGEVRVELPAGSERRRALQDVQRRGLYGLPGDLLAAAGRDCRAARHEVCLQEQ
jgi:hypothetical protein